MLNSFNGVRINMVDFLAKGPKYQRVMLWIVVGLTLVLLAGFLPRHLGNVFGGGH